MNPTNFQAPSDIMGHSVTDYRPKKSLYACVKDNNHFRRYLQQNAEMVRHQYALNYFNTMRARCEPRFYHLRK